MSIDSKFIALLRAEIEKHSQHSLATIVSGRLDEKAYGYACGYLKALYDVVRTRGKTASDTPGMIEQILEDMRKE